MYIENDNEVSLISIKLTEKGRELLAKGLKEDNVFDVVKFSFGDSEVDYSVTTIDETLIMEPENRPSDLKSKIYASGTIPSGQSNVSLTSTDVVMSQYQSGLNVGVSTVWPPVTGIYLEKYSWTNLGPLEDYDFNIVLSVDTRTASLQSFGVAGTTQIKVEGQTTGSYAILTFQIT